MHWNKVSTQVQTFLLAGGKGKRFSSYSGEIPKPLIIVGGQPLIMYSLEALSYASLQDVTLVISDSKLQVKPTMPCLWTQGTESIFYVIYQCCCVCRCPYALFLDADSIYNRDILQEFIGKMDLCDTWDMVIGASIHSHSSTNWKFETDGNRVIEVTRESCKMPHYAILVKRDSLRAVFHRVLLNTSILLHKEENHFLPGYEDYYLGWGLLFKLFLEYGYYIRLEVCNRYFANVNSPEDIRLISLQFTSNRELQTFASPETA